MERGNALAANNHLLYARRAHQLILGWMTVCGQVHHLHTPYFRKKQIYITNSRSKNDLHLQSFSTTMGQLDLLHTKQVNYVALYPNSSNILLLP